VGCWAVASRKNNVERNVVEPSQVFEGSVSGGVSGRDLLNIESMEVHVHTQPQPRRSGDYGYLQKAKDHMPPVCHGELDWLANYSDVHAKCLLLACKNKALICKDGRLARAAFFPDCSIGSVMIAILFAFCAYAALIWFKFNLPQTRQLMLFGCMAACSLGIWWLQREFFYSHQVARRAVAALSMAAGARSDGSRFASNDN